MTTVEPPRTRRRGTPRDQDDAAAPRGSTPDPRTGEGPRRRPAAGPAALAALRGLVQEGAAQRTAGAAHRTAGVAQRTAGAALRGLAERVAPTDDPAVTAQLVELDEADEDGAPAPSARQDRRPAPAGAPRPSARRKRATARGTSPAPAEPAPAAPRRPLVAARAGGPIDPRFKARRLAVRRTEGRKRLRVLTAVGVVVAGLLTAYGLSRSAVLDVDHITVVGATQVYPDFVIAAAGVEVGDPILYTDLGAVAARVERLPWVSDAVVTRSLPGDLTITVTERVPVAWSGLSDGTALGLDASGVAIGILGGPRDGLVEIDFCTPPPAALGDPIPEATGAAAYAGELARGRYDLAARGGLVRITVCVPAAATPAVDPVTGAPVEPTGDPTATTATTGLDDAGSGLDDAARTAALSTFVAHLGDGSEIRLGDGTEVAAKLEALETVLEYLGPEPFRYVDVAVPASPAVGVLPPLNGDGTAADGAEDTAG